MTGDARTDAAAPVTLAGSAAGMLLAGEAGEASNTRTAAPRAAVKETQP